MKLFRDIGIRRRAEEMKFRVLLSKRLHSSRTNGIGTGPALSRRYRANYSGFGVIKFIVCGGNEIRAFPERGRAQMGLEK